jgi:hypothetical protein
VGALAEGQRLLLTLIGVGLFGGLVAGR